MCICDNCGKRKPDVRAYELRDLITDFPLEMDDEYLCEDCLEELSEVDDNIMYCLRG